MVSLHLNNSALQLNEPLFEEHDMLWNISPTFEMYEKWSGKTLSCSVKEVTGNYIKALDGDMGHLEDFIIDTKTWVISSIVVDIKNWWPTKKVLIWPLWVDRVDLIGSIVFVDLPQDYIKNRPEFEHKTFSKPEAAGL